ncbi:hypothetical protein [Brochothrix thermosphacta]|uniref:hypothetical protein n=1 Tax=Brochothrix thermosphacta TaxID=2756 RepID=UPI001C4EA790|nr:hypothetical protein [Brochothrix thermosphacta]
MEYRKKPVVVEVLKYEGVPVGEAIRFCENKAHIDVNANLYIRTLEGHMRVFVGDYIIKGVQGEFYPCKPDIFEATYESCEECFRPEVSD